MFIFKVWLSNLLSWMSVVFKGEVSKLQLNVSSWRKWYSDPEKQKQYGLDTLSCTIQAILNMIEAVFNYLIAKEKIDEEHLEFLKNKGYLIDGKINFSKKWIAQQSDTSKSGNTFQAVVQAIKRVGLVPEVMYAWEQEEDTWSEYYREDYEKRVRKIGKEFKEYFHLSFPWRRRQDFEYYKRYSPYTVGVFAWWRDEDGFYINPNNYQNNHGTNVYEFEENFDWCRDSYSPFDKKLGPSNRPDWGLGVRVYLKKNKI